MNPILKRVIVETVKRKLKPERSEISDKEYDKKVRNLTVEVAHVLRDLFFILIGTFSAGFGLKGFLLPNSFIDGGVMGISLITEAVTAIPLSVLIVTINLPFIIIAFFAISREFAIKSIVGIIVLAIVVYFTPYPLITDDKLLVSVFGGFFLGLGIGLAIRGGSVIDGTEVLAVFISRKTPLSIGDVIFLFNVLIFLVGAYVFSIEIALYAILTYLAASKTVDFVVSGIEEYVGVTIISDKSEEIRLTIIEKLGRGCTIYSGKKGFARRGEKLQETDIVYTLITRLEIARLQTEVDKIDKKAFMVMHSIKDARGGMIKKLKLINSKTSLK